MSTQNRTKQMHRDALSHALQIHQHLEVDTARRRADEIIDDLEEIGFKITRTSDGGQLSWTTWIQDWQRDYNRSAEQS